MEERYKLYQGDCLEVMDELIEEGIKVDCVITDPPYNITRNKWDVAIPLNEMWERLNKLIKFNGAIAMFGTEPFSSLLRMSNIENFKYDWIWIKNRPTGFVHAKNKPMKKHEIISMFSLGVCNHKSISGDKRMEYFPIGVSDSIEKEILPSKHGNLLQNYQNQIGTVYKSQTGFPNDILYYNSVEKHLHPTQKPVDLLEYLIKTYTNKGDLVLDFTMGSGSTGVACMNTNRNFIGIELDKNYFNIAKGRIEEALIDKGDKNE